MPTSNKSGSSADGSQSSEKLSETEIAIKQKPKYATFMHIYFLAIIFVLGDLVVGWHHALSSGLWDFLLVNTAVGFAYICLSLCQAEMTSMLPFSGGTYGFARVTLGPFAGYVVGCLEVLSNWAFLVDSVELFGDLMQYMCGSSNELQPLWWLLFFAISLPVLLMGSKYFYPTCTAVGIVSLLLLLLYLLAAAPQMDTQQYVLQQGDRKVFRDGALPFLLLLPTVSHEWLGMQSISLACEDAHNATKVVPIAMVSAVSTLFFISFVVAIAAVSHAPGINSLRSTTAPLNFGFAAAFDIPQRAATAFSLLAVFGVGLSHFFACARQLLALARSRLVSRVFARTLHCSSSSGRGSDEPALAALTLSTAAVALLLLVQYGFAHEVHIFTHSMLISAYLVYLAVFASYCIFRVSYSTMPRQFRNPLGYSSVVVGSTVFLLCFVAVLALDEDSVWAVCICAALLLLLVVYYYAVASRTQTYSKEEQNLLLKLYVIKNNAKKRNKKRSSGSRASAAVGGRSRSKNNSSCGNSSDGGSCSNINIKNNSNKNNNNGSNHGSNDGSNHNSISRNGSIGSTSNNREIVDFSALTSAAFPAALLSIGAGAVTAVAVDSNAATGAAMNTAGADSVVDFEHATIADSTGEENNRGGVDLPLQQQQQQQHQSGEPREKDSDNGSVRAAESTSRRSSRGTATALASTTLASIATAGTTNSSSKGSGSHRKGGAVTVREFHSSLKQTAATLLNEGTESPFTTAAAAAGTTTTAAAAEEKSFSMRMKDGFKRIGGFSSKVEPEPQPTATTAATSAAND